MKHWLVLYRTKGTAGKECVAQTADLDLVKTVIDRLNKNFLFEDDEHDRIFDPEFIRTAPAVATGLADEIRQAAGRGWLEKEGTDNEENDNEVG